MNDLEIKRTAKQARGYREDPTYERIRSMEPIERERILEKLGSEKRIGYGFYVSARDASEGLAQETRR